MGKDLFTSFWIAIIGMAITGLLFLILIALSYSTGQFFLRIGYDEKIGEFGFILLMVFGWVWRSAYVSEKKRNLR